MVENLKLKAKEQKGFTLIELLAVIVILGIIAAIAIPAIGNVISKSEKKAQVQDALLIINAAKLYVADNRPAAETILTMNNTVDDPATTTVNEATTGIDDYLERVEDKDFSVKVSYNTANGKYSYQINNHEAVIVVNDGGAKNAGYVSEQDLADKID
jgi:type IV pilus assembly protein PilA